jgi:protein-S-isoprenylcysteine O-methyltransferase Ste14
MLTFARLVIAASWLVLFGYFVSAWPKARIGRAESGRRVNHVSVAGMFFEFSGLAVVPFFRVEDPGLPLWVYGCAVGLAMVSAALGIVAGVHLGRQFRMQAVVTDQHRLITSGPYSVLRHPIYASLIGLVIATALTFADWRVLGIALPLMVLGTEIRVRTEDRLLSSHFGVEFETYRRRVKAYLPGLR